MDTTKLQSQITMFKNRLVKKHQHLSKWSRRNNITAYRLYDRDIPEIPLTVDFYGCVDDNKHIENIYACVALFERPYEKEPIEEDIWLDNMSDVIADVLQIDREHIIVKHRRRQKGTDQYEKSQNIKSIKGIVCEGKLQFYVNLSDYLDTGLFLDHRPLRRKLLESAQNKRVLNLFGYTGALSVASAWGNASFVQTVDLSNTYLNWARENLQLNGFINDRNYPMTRSDVMEYLNIQSRKIQHSHAPGFDIILLDPPTFSNSSMTTNVLDINRDWPQLVRNSLELLNPGGILYFSTNSKKLSFHEDLLPTSIHQQEIKIQDITPQSIPEDFKNHRIHRCWKVTV